MAITGYFTKVEAPAKVKPGDRIKANIGYFARNPEAPTTPFYTWSTCIMAKMGDMVMIVDPSKENGKEGNHPVSEYNLFTMPDSRQTIQVRILGIFNPDHIWNVSQWAGG